MIETIVDKKKDLTIHKCSGSLTDEKFKEAIQSFYDGNPTMNVIWDFSKASLADTPTITVKQSSMMVKRLGSTRQNGKSAVIASRDLEYGMARMFQIMTENGGIPFKIKVFRSFDEAMQWLIEKKR
ncbi:MAG TPA: hypothetical protein VMZ05_07485 [Spirochaetota bacterium]|nr:hypothetical protein [Spirochaetota bacterium]